MKLVCAICDKAMSVETIGMRVVEMFGEPPEPYKVWAADLYKCHGCAAEIAAGFGSRPLKEHFEDGFAEWLESEKAEAPAVIYDYERKA